MNRRLRNIFLGLIIVISSVLGFFLQEREKSSYVVEMESSAGEPTHSSIPSASDSVLSNDSTQKPADNSDNSELRININTASHEELKKLYGIGDVKADRIIKYRETKGPFEVIEDIMKIEGIGRKIFEKFRENITVD